MILVTMKGDDGRRARVPHSKKVFFAILEWGVCLTFGKAFSDDIVQSAVLFKHGRPITPRDFINFHGSLDDFPI